MRECLRVLGIGKTTIGDIVLKARAAGVDWVVVQSLSAPRTTARCYRAQIERRQRAMEESVGGG